MCEVTLQRQKVYSPDIQAFILLGKYSHFLPNMFLSIFDNGSYFDTKKEPWILLQTGV